MRAIAVAFVGADPKLAVVAAGVARLSRADRVAFDGLGVEGGAGGGPIGEVALLEIQIQNATVGGGCCEAFLRGFAPDFGLRRLAPAAGRGRLSAASAGRLPTGGGRPLSLRA